MRVIVKFTTVLVVCAMSCLARHIAVKENPVADIPDSSDSMDTLGELDTSDTPDAVFEKEFLELISGHNDMDTDLYKETEIDIDLPEDSGQLRVIIEEKVDGMDTRGEPMSSRISSSLKASSKNIAEFEKSLKRDMKHLVVNLLVGLKELSRGGGTHSHHKHNHPRSRPKRDTRTIFRDNNVQSILIEYFRQKQGEDNGNPLLRFG